MFLLFSHPIAFAQVPAKIYLCTVIRACESLTLGGIIPYLEDAHSSVQSVPQQVSIRAKLVACYNI